MNRIWKQNFWPPYLGNVYAVDKAIVFFLNTWAAWNELKKWITGLDNSCWTSHFYIKIISFILIFLLHTLEQPISYCPSASKTFCSQRKSLVKNSYWVKLFNKNTLWFLWGWGRRITLVQAFEAVLHDDHACERPVLSSLDNTMGTCLWKKKKKAW